MITLQEVETTAETGIGTDPTGVVSVPTGGVDKSQLLREITSNTPGLTRSTSPRSEGGGVRLLFAPEPHESVTFALWFGPLPCFQAEERSFPPPRVFTRTTSNHFVWWLVKRVDTAGREMLST